MKSKKGFENIEIDLTDEQFIFLAKMAHEKDITFNKLCNDMLREYIDKIDKE